MVRSLAFTLALALAVGAAGFDFDDEADVPAAGAAQAAAAQPKAEVVSKSVPLQHRIGEAADFTERSKLWYRESATGGGLRVRIAQGKLAGPELAAFEKLVQTGGFYTLKLPSVLDDASSPPVYASVSVCALVASRFEESLELTLSPAGTITAMSYTVPRVPEACPSAALPKIMFDDVLFNTAVSVIYPPEGPKPIGQVHPASFVPAHAAQAMQQAAKAHADGTGGGDGKPQEPPQSFIRKYWMYILPVMLALSMSGGDEKKEGEGKDGEGGGGGGGGAAKAAGGGGAAAGGGGGKAVKRK